MTIIEKNINSITPYERNPRLNDNAVDAVAASIREFGFKVPIIIDKDGVIVAGHTRLKAAKKLGLETVPCVIADDLDEDQIKAFRLADNKVSEFAEWDLDLLDLELADIDLDMEVFGFDLGDDDPVEVVEDDYEPVLPKEPKAKRGDIYQLGRHRLMCGDSLNEADCQKLAGGGCWQTYFSPTRRIMSHSEWAARWTRHESATAAQMGLSL